MNIKLTTICLVTAALVSPFIAQVADTSSKGEVSLSGQVRSQVEAEKAISIARATQGVTSVKHTLRVKKDDRGAG